MPSTAQEEGVRRWVLKSQLGLGRLWSLGAVSLAGPSEFKGHHACFHVFQSTGTSQNKCWKGYWSCGIFWDFPGYPVVKTPPFQCRRCKFDPWSGNLNPACAQHDPSKKRKREHLAYFKYLQQLPIEHLPPTPPHCWISGVVLPLWSVYPKSTFKTLREWQTLDFLGSSAPWLTPNSDQTAQ